jgi:hypothetical protein
MHTQMISMLGLLSLSMSLWVGQARGHHGWSGYDSAQTLSLTGTIQGSGYEHRRLATENGDDGGLQGRPFSIR